jgi:hypothetical protein
MKRLCWIVVAVLGIVPGAARSDSIDENARLVCAAVDLASCAPGDGCQRETAASMNVPELIVVDLKAQQITGKRPSGETLTTRIDRMTHNQNLLVLEGVQNALSWTLTVTDDTDQMSMAAVGDGVAFTVFGRCMQK